MSRLQLEPIIESWVGMFLLALAMVGVPLLVRIHGGDLTSRRQQLLIGLRLTATLGVLTAALRPSIIQTDSQPGRATLAVLLDRSKSMSLEAGDGRTRWSVQQEVIRSLAPALAGLDDSLQVKWFIYAEQADESSVPELLATADQSPKGTATDLAAALSAALGASAGEPLAGVILAGDGVHNPPVVSAQTTTSAANGSRVVGRRDEDPQALARALGGLDVPLWTIPIGPPGDRDQVRDVEIDQLPESLTVFSGNEFSVDFVLRSRGLQGIELPVRVWLSPEDRPEERTELASRGHLPGRASDAFAFSIPATVSEPGAYRLEVAVDAQPGETLLSNNSQFAFLEVRPGGGRVLYIEGQPRPEQTFLKRAMRRFPDLELTYRWIAPSAGSPPTTDDWFQAGRYDIFIIGDLAATSLPPQAWEHLTDAVRSGAGLLMLGGLATFDAGGYRDSPLADVLPIRLGELGREFQLEGPLAPQLPRLHPITSLDPTDLSLDDQQAAWDRLPPLLGANRLGAPRVAPGVNVLLETPNGEPLLVIGEFGQGRVIAFAADSTWRWWRQGADVAHRRFWRQLLMWLIDRADQDQAEITVELDRRRFATGEAVSWRAFSNDPQGDSDGDVDQATALPTAELLGGDDQESRLPVPVSLAPTGSGRPTFMGTLSSLEPGIYRLRVTAADGSSHGEQSFQVLDADRELEAPFADTTYLAQLSAQTAVAGGTSFQTSQLDELLARIAELRRTSAAPVVSKLRLADGPATAWPLWLFIVGCLAIEWVLRRRWGLV